MILRAAFLRVLAQIGGQQPEHAHQRAVSTTPCIRKVMGCPLIARAAAIDRPASTGWSRPTGVGGRFNFPLSVAHCKGRRRVACFHERFFGAVRDEASQESYSTETSPSAASTRGCSAPSSSISAAASMAASTSLATPPPTSAGFAATCSTSSRSSAPRSSRYPGGNFVSSYNGKTASVPSRSGRGG